MQGMTDEIRRAVLSEMTRQGITQDELAGDADVTRTQMSRMLNGHSNQLPKAWEAVLKKLDLRLIVVPNDTEVLLQRKA